MRRCALVILVITRTKHAETSCPSPRTCTKLCGPHNHDGGVFGVFAHLAMITTGCSLSQVNVKSRHPTPASVAHDAMHGHLCCCFHPPQDCIALFGKPLDPHPAQALAFSDGVASGQPNHAAFLWGRYCAANERFWPPELPPAMRVALTGTCSWDGKGNRFEWASDEQVGACLHACWHVCLDACLDACLLACLCGSE